MTSDPRVAGTVQGEFYGTATIEFDHGADGTVDGSSYVSAPGQEFVYDPRANDSSLSNPNGSFLFMLYCRTVSYDSSYQATTGDWQLVSFTLESPPPAMSVRYQDAYGIEQELNGNSVDFGSTALGSPVATTFTVLNTGGSDLTLSSGVSVPSGFSVVSSPNSTVPPGGSTTFTIQLDAWWSGSAMGWASLYNNDPSNSMFGFSVSGWVTTPDIGVSVDWYSLYDGCTSSWNPVSFGTTYFGTPLSKTFTVTNVGIGDLTLGALTLPFGFSLVTPPASFVPPWQTTSFTIQLDASSPGSFSGNVSLANNDADSNPFDFYIAGEVTVPPAEISVWADGSELWDSISANYFYYCPLSFGYTVLGTPVPKTFTVWNTGTADLTVGDWLTLPAGFSLVSPPASAVPPGSSTTFTIQLDAVGDGMYTGGNGFSYGGWVSLANSDSDESPFDFSVSGEVRTPTIDVRDPSWSSVADDSGNVFVGSTAQGTPLPYTFTISNWGSADLLLDPSSLVLPAGFSLATGLVSSIPPGGNTILAVRLDAAAPGDYSGSISFATNDPYHTSFDFTVTGQVIGTTPVNEAPTLDAILDPDAIGEDAGPQTVNLSGILAGGGETQLLQVTATTTNSQLISNVAVTYTSPATGGTLSFTPAPNQSGTAIVTVTVTDDGGTDNGGVDTFQRSFLVSVNPVNDAPLLLANISPIEMSENSAVTVTGLSCYFDDADVMTSGDLLSYSVAITAADPNDPQYDADLVTAWTESGALHVQSAAGHTGHVDLTVRATDLALQSAVSVVRVTVPPPTVNRAPQVIQTIDDLTVEAGSDDRVSDVSAVFEDLDVIAGTDSLTYTVTNSNPDVLTATVTGSALSLSFVGGQVGVATLTVRATDSYTAYAETSFSVTVVPFNNPPTATAILAVSVDEDAADVVLNLWDYFADIEDPDSDLVLNVASATESDTGPLAFDLDPSTGQLTLSFLPNAFGTAEYAVLAGDMGGKTVVATLSLTVNPVNDAPTGPAAPVALSLASSPQVTVIDLWSYFDDAEDGPCLSYNIVAGSITDPAAFEGTPIIDGGGFLRLDGALPVGNGSQLTVQAADVNGSAALGTFVFSAPDGGGGDDDEAPAPLVSIIDVKHTGETAPGAGYFVIARTDDSSAIVEVQYALGGDAQYGIDYTSSEAASGPLSLGPGERITISVNASDNSVIDGARTVTLTLTGASGGATLDTATKDLFLNDDDNGALVYVAHSKNTWKGANGADQGEFTIESIGDKFALKCPPIPGYTCPVPPPGGGYFVGPAPGTAVAVAVPVALSSYDVVYQITRASGQVETHTIAMGPGASRTIPVVPPACDCSGVSQNETLQLLGHDPGTLVWILDANHQYVGSLGLGSYSLGSPDNGTVTIEEKDAVDAVGSTCCTGQLGYVAIFVQAPPIPLSLQMANNIANGLPPHFNLNSGHTYVYGFTPGVGAFAWGFYPGPGAQFLDVKKGEIIGDWSHPWNYFKRWPACPDTVRSLREHIQNDIDALADADPSNDLLYSILDSSFANNKFTCTTWALEKLHDLGIAVTLFAEPFDVAHFGGLEPR